MSFDSYLYTFQNQEHASIVAKSQSILEDQPYNVLEYTLPQDGTYYAVVESRGCDEIDDLVTYASIQAIVKEIHHIKS